VGEGGGAAWRQMAAALAEHELSSATARTSSLGCTHGRRMLILSELNDDQSPTQIRFDF
jgi:hypothetical protein